MDLWSSGSDVLYEHVPYNFREDVPHDRYVLCNQRKDVSPEILAVLVIPAEPDADSDVRNHTYYRYSSVYTSESGVHIA